MDLDEIREHAVNDALDARREPSTNVVVQRVGEPAEEEPTRLSFLTTKGNELLARAKRGVAEGKVEAALMRDIDSVLLDGCEMFNHAIEAELERRGA